VLLAALCAALLAFAPSGARAAEGLSAVASTTVIADLVKNVGGSKAAVRALAPAGSDPHTFQPTPESMKVLARANIAFFNGAGLEEWWGKTVRSVGRKDLPVVELSAGLATLKASGDAHGHTHGAGADPHVWLDPVLVKRYVERIGDALSRVDAANAAAYAKNAAAYQAALDELDAWIRIETGKIPPERRKMVTFHNAFQYFAKRYGLAVRGYIVASPGKEPSAKTLADLTRRIKAERIPAVFAEADFNPKLVETLARDAGVKVVTTLYDGSLTDGPPADSYLAMMRHNVTQIVSALR
jgi:ABC-type Zn uptake system ZnuABC Zn-binding protein ZnuA